MTTPWESPMETLENHLRDALRHRADQEPVRPAPLTETLRTGRQSRNRRRLATASAIAATAAVALAAPVVLSNQPKPGLATPPAATPSTTPSPTAGAEQPRDPRLRQEEQRLVDAFSAAGITGAEVFEHGAPGDAWVAAPLPSGRTGVAHTNAARVLTPGTQVGEAQVSGTLVTMVETEALGPTAQFACREFSGEVSVLEDFQPGGTRSEVLALARDLLQQLRC